MKFIRLKLRSGIALINLDNVTTITEQFDGTSQVNFNTQSDDTIKIPMPLDEVEKLINDIQNRKWISVKDKLPEFGVDCLVTDGVARMVAFYNGDCWDFYRNTFWTSEEVTHWMPLPETTNF